MSKQTAVDYLLHALHAAGFIEDITDPLLIQRVNEAKAMHKEEIKDSVGVGSQFDRDYLYGYHDKAEQYYNETYGKEAGHEA